MCFNFQVLLNFKDNIGSALRMWPLGGQIDSATFKLTHNLGETTVYEHSHETILQEKT